MKKYVSDEEFIRAWMNPGKSLDVAKALGLSLSWVRLRAVKLRKLGVKLPYRPRGRVSRPPVNPAGLNRLIREMGKGTVTE